MTYGALEASVADGSPFALVQFTRGVVRNYFTTEANDVETVPDYFDSPNYFAPDDYFTRLWKASSVDRSEVKSSGDWSEQEVTLSFPISDAFASKYLEPAGPTPTTVTIWRGHRGDGEFSVVFKGKIVRPVIRGEEIDLVCESVFTSLKRNGLRAVYQRSCRHVLYHGGCGLSRTSFEVSETTTALAGFELTVAGAASQPDQFYRGGIVDFNGELGFIIDHTGATLRISSSIDGLSDEIIANGSAAISIAPGCDLSISTCAIKFGNALNNGGFPYIPGKNPFSGSSII